MGLQIVLFNPINLFAWAYASWRFFSVRIKDEEETLIEFFGQNYIDYRKRTYIGIPGIRSDMSD